MSRPCVMLSTTKAFLVTKSVPLLMQGTSCEEPSSNVQNQFIKPQHCWCESFDRHSAEGSWSNKDHYYWRNPARSAARYWQLALSVWELSCPECASTEVEQRASFQMQLHYAFPANFMPACFIGSSGCHTLTYSPCCPQPSPEAGRLMNAPCAWTPPLFLGPGSRS